MSIVNVKESWSGTSSEGSREILKGDALRTVTRVFTVLTDDAADGPLYVEGPAGVTAGLPDYGHSHPLDIWLLVTGRSVTTRSPTLFDVTITYVRIYQGDPTAELPIPAWGSMRSTEDIDFDAAGNPIVTMNGEFYDPPLQREVSDLVLTITRNEPAFVPGIAALFGNKVNAAVWHTFAPGTVLCKQPLGQLVEDRGVAFWAVRYEFHVRSDGWRRRVLHRGYRVRKLNADGTKKFKANGVPWIETAVDPLGKPVTQPVNLDNRGAEMIPKDGGGFVDENGAAVSAHYLYYNLFPAVDFTLLGLDW